MKGIRNAFWMGALAATVAWSAHAHADGAVIPSSRLSEATRSELRAWIAEARLAHPESFERLTWVARHLPELDATKRGRYPVVTPALRAQGRDGLLPMLEVIVFDAQPRGELSNDTWTAWQAALVESVGALRDERSAPVLEAVLHDPQASPMVARAAAAALAKLETDAVAKTLIAMSRTTGPRRQAALFGMGHCRRTAVAQRLAEALGRTTEPEDIRLIAHALGNVASAWAWKGRDLRHPKEEAAVREMAAQALVAKLPRVPHDVRPALIKAVLVVDHPSTPAFIERAKSRASAGDRVVLGELRRRFDDSPLRK
ncbi:MAG: hypothetical protein CVU63_17745 [Deltaproteobacteria bacterium HGW-Deltaproteobacteria-20]|jgi:hypothetical protein|nr:MAG: hypothetical protein CVU63_17745 [Deltaproteobacteria bacterium HGW-Deltaproteobacteria-20]